MADCYINDTLFELKAPEGKSIKCVERNLVKAINHQSPNVVIDSFRIKNVQDRSFKVTCCLACGVGVGCDGYFFVNRQRKVIDINSLLV